jgi:uncharacterized protein (TIGR00288 family)
MKSHRVGDGERSLAVFIDFENMGLGFNNRRDRFEIAKVLERLVEKGKIVCKKAYADWSRFGMYTGALHESAIELIEIPRRGITGKNSADIRLVVDAIDLAYSKDHIDTFVIVSGDSDFSPLVSKLKELGKHVIGLGLVDATSDLLRDNCDEFIYYEDLDRAPIHPVATNDALPERKRKVFALLLDSLLALRRENKEIIYSSMLKDTIKRKKPSFNEEYYGYRTFSELLEDAQKEGLLEIEKHKSSGMYVVTRFGLEMKAGSGSGVVPAVRNGIDGKRAAEVRPAAVSDQTARREPARSRTLALPAPPPPVKPVARPAVATPVPPVARSTTVAPPLPPAEEPAAPLERALGRALVDEVDDLDDSVDEVPSYGPGRAAPPAKPATVTKPAVNAKPAAKSGQAPRSRGGPQAKPAAAAKPPAKPARSAPPQQSRRRAQPKPAPEPKPAPKPMSDDEEFGAGIGD